MLRVSVGLACALALAGCAAVPALAGSAAELATIQRCFKSKVWCVASLTDQITLHKMPFAMLAARGPSRVKGTSNRVAWHIPCEAGAPALYLSAESLLSYNDIRVRFRADPGGVIGTALADHTGGGKMFTVTDPQKLIDVMKAKETLTVEITLPMNADRAHATFSVGGLAGALRKIECG